MHTVHGHRQLSSPPREAVVAIGNFDGVHLGHQEIFRLAREKAAQRGGTSVVLTFDPHPAQVLAPDLAPPLILPLARKLELIAALNIDLCVVEPFTAELAAMSPESFIDQVLASALAAREVVVGEDFTYGAERAGTTATLKSCGATRGFDVTIVGKVTMGGLVASSTKIREFVLEGRVDAAARLLGRPFEMTGRVVRGAGRGRTLGIPTANVRVEGDLLPRTGVYAGHLRLGAERYPAVVNIGVNPTFTPGDALSIEAHVLDYEGDLYDKTVRLELAARLRPEERFGSAQALLTQIGRDIAQARALLDPGGNPPSS